MSGRQHIPRLPRKLRRNIVSVPVPPAVLDETDLIMCSQLDRAAATRVGESKTVTILFSDVVDSTSMSEQLSPYDLLYLLNRYFVQVGDIIERNGGFIDRFIGDGVMTVLDSPTRVS